MTMSIRQQLIERFFRYVSITSQSDIRAATLPSTPGQQRLAELLADELRALGLDDVVIDHHATVTAVKRGTVAGAPKIGFIAHLDTFDAGLSPDIRPQLLCFTGEDLCLNRAEDIWLRVAEYPQLRDWIGAEIIASDGTSVLGADNKAAITVIMTLLAELGPQDRHGDIVVAFVPDEEIGLRGAKALDLTRFSLRLRLHDRCLRARRGGDRELQCGQRRDHPHRRQHPSDVGQGRSGEPGADGPRRHQPLRPRRDAGEYRRPRRLCLVQRHHRQRQRSPLERADPRLRQGALRSAQAPPHRGRGRDRRALSQRPR
jgi:hypothetical protein